MDFFADNFVKRCIGVIIDGKEKIKDDTAIWKSLTRLMFLHYPTPQVYDWVHEGLAKASDEQWVEKKWVTDKTFPKRDYDYKQPERKSVIKLNLKKARIKKMINDNLKITEVATSYGIIVKGKKALCPFHKDKAPSLSFSDEKNVFNCFGCKAKGDVIEFIRRMENEMPKMS